MLEGLLGALGATLSWQVIGYLLLGAIIGDLFAALPGVTVVQAVALVLPFTGYLPITHSLALMVGMYKGGMFGGATAAILVGIPGDPQDAPKVLDGHPLARQGKAGKALKAALVSDLIADTLAAMVLIFATALLTPLALLVGPPEYFAIAIFTLTVIGVLGGSSPSKGLMAATAGFLLATVGMDPIHGRARFTFGVTELAGGISLVPLVLGLFSISEVLLQVQQRLASGKSALRHAISEGDNSLSWSELRAILPTILRSTGIGAVASIFPGIGGQVAGFLTYGISHRLSKHPELYGKGSLEGLVAAEAGTASTVGPTLVPMLTLGIPHGGIAALFLAAFMMEGITPGPTLHQQHPELVYGLYALFLLAVPINFFAGYLTRLAARNVLRTPDAMLYPIVVVLVVVGSFALNNSWFDAYVAVASGVLGYVMLRLGFPVVPFIIAFILASLVEHSLGQSLLMFDAGLIELLTRPIAAAFLALALASVVLSTQLEKRSRTKPRVVAEAA